MASRKLKIMCIEALEAGLKWKGKRILSIDLNNKISKEIIVSQHHHPPVTNQRNMMQLLIWTKKKKMSMSRPNSMLNLKKNKINA